MLALPGTSNVRRAATGALALPLDGQEPVQDDARRADID